MGVSALAIDPVAGTGSVVQFWLDGYIAGRVGVCDLGREPWGEEPLRAVAEVGFESELGFRRVEDAYPDFPVSGLHCHLIPCHTCRVYPDITDWLLD